MSMSKYANKADMLERNKRNLRPHKAAVAAMYLYGKEYSEQRGGSMDFWDALDPSRQDICRRLVKAIEEARGEPPAAQQSGPQEKT